MIYHISRFGSIDRQKAPVILRLYFWRYIWQAFSRRLSFHSSTLCFPGTQPTAWRSPCPWRWQRTTRTSATTPRCGSLRRRSWAKAKRSRARELRILSSQERSHRLFGIRYLTFSNLLKQGLDQHSREECKWMWILHRGLKWSFKQVSICHHRSVCSDYFALCSVENM